MSLATRLATVLRTTPAGALARLWHRWAPSFPVRRTVFGFAIHYDFRDHPYYWISSRKHLETMEPIFDLLPREPCALWDVGSNVGIFSLRATQLGHRATAFDISTKALGLLARSAKANGFDIRTVPRALGTTKFSYQPPDSSNADNRLVAASGGPVTSLTFAEAAREYGTPGLIKMDIEGGETEFLKCREFKDWIVGNRILWIVEMHTPEAWQNLWTDVPNRKLDEAHCVINERAP